MKWDQISWREFSGIQGDPPLVDKFNKLGLPAIMKMGQKIVLAPLVIFGTLVTFEYILTPSVYYDEYDGTASEYTQTSKW